MPLLCLKLVVEGIHQPAQLQLLLHGPGVVGGAHLAILLACHWEGLEAECII